MGTSIDLSFSSVPEYERTKHVHRLHPYLGKFIPQLVEVFLREYFSPGDWILDPFCGSGTTLVEANVLRMPTVGVELSEFSCLITRAKTTKYDIPLLEKEVKDILHKTCEFSLLREKEKSIFANCYVPYQTDREYLTTWFAPRALQELLFYKDHIKDYTYQDVLKVILSRSARSARLVPHYDLAHPKEPVREAYYCYKHKKTCMPTTEAVKFISRYSRDALKRIKQFDKIRSDTYIEVICGDARYIDLDKHRFHGIFTSPPYFGMIDYHEQHRYAFELLDLPQYSTEEIGSAARGRSKMAHEQYEQDLIMAFQNLDRFLYPKAQIFLVVDGDNETFLDLADVCGYSVVNIMQRPVTRRTQKELSAFSEKIYHFTKG